MSKRMLLTSAIGFFSLGFISLVLLTFSVNTSLDNWYSGFSGFIQASNTQKQEQKPLLVFFYTDWCVNCKNLREKVLVDDEVQQFLKQVIPVQINPEQGVLENQLAEEFGVRGYPSLFVISPAQKARALRGVTNTSPQKFIANCQSAIKAII